MYYKSKLDIVGIIVVFVMLLGFNVIAYLIFQNIIIMLFLILIIILFTLLLITQAFFFEDYIKVGNPIFKKFKLISYDSIIKVILFKKGDIRFESNPSLIIFYKNNNQVHKTRFVVDNDDNLINLLSFLYRTKNIKIVKDSNLKAHKNISI